MKKVTFAWYPLFDTYSRGMKPYWEIVMLGAWDSVFSA